MRQRGAAGNPQVHVLSNNIVTSGFRCVNGVRGVGERAESIRGHVFLLYTQTSSIVLSRWDKHRTLGLYGPTATNCACLCTKDGKDKTVDVADPLIEKMARALPVRMRTIQSDLLHRILAADWSRIHVLATRGTHQGPISHPLALGVSGQVVRLYQYTAESEVREAYEGADSVPFNILTLCPSFLADVRCMLIGETDS